MKTSSLSPKPKAKISADLTVIEKSTNPLIATALSIEITPKTIKEATDTLTELNQALKRATTEKERITRPLNDLLKVERSRWKPFETVVEDAIAKLRRKLGDYQTELTNTRKGDEQAIADRVGAGKGYLKPQTASEKISALPTLDTHIEGDAGTLKFRTDKKFEVMDVTMLPHQYILPDEVAIRQAMKAGLELPGVRYWEEQTPINSR